MTMRKILALFSSGNNFTRKGKLNNSIHKSAVKCNFPCTENWWCGRKISVKIIKSEPGISIWKFLFHSQTLKKLEECYIWRTIMRNVLIGYLSFHWCYIVRIHLEIRISYRVFIWTVDHFQINMTKYRILSYIMFSQSKMVE